MRHNDDEPLYEQTPNDKTPVKWLTTQEVLARLNISKRTLQNWRSKGIMPYSEVPGSNKLFYDETDLQLIMEKGKLWKKKSGK